MSEEKFDVKKHNFRVRIQKAALRNKTDEVCIIAQEIYEADYELEDLGLLPAMFSVVASILISKKWTPSIKNQLDA